MKIITHFFSVISILWSIEILASESNQATRPIVFPEHITESLIKAKLIKVFGSLIKANDIELLGDEQIVEVVLQDGTTVHFTPDAGYMIYNGSLFSLNGSEIINVTDTRKMPLRKKLVNSIPDNDLVIFEAKGKVHGSISIFTDIDCGYCRRLHQEVEELNNQGITVRYFSFPRAGVSDSYGLLTNSYKKLKSVWCSVDRKEAMNAAKSTGNIEANTGCDVDLKKQFLLGKDLGISGTPAIVLEDGSLIAGYRPAKDLVKLIK